MRRAKSLIVRGLLTRGTDRKAVSENKEIIGGTYNSSEGVLGRVFLLENGDKATLLWQGPANQFRPNYMRIRDELVGKVPYRLYGRAASKNYDVSEDKSLIAFKKEPRTQAQVDKVPEARGVIREKTLQLTEKQFEDILAKYPELIEDGLELKGRQVNISGKVLDLLFKDGRGDTLIVELKKGTIKREHIAQLLDYEGFFVDEFNPTTRVMLIGNHVPKNLQNSLDHHGIEYKYYSPASLREYLIEKGDKEMLDALGW
ncbi:MAG: DUF91 domain-containing protein [Firmicutes bacterium]|nr:DUF91 domain-containing protein [Bacillota bacterium]